MKLRNKKTGEIAVCYVMVGIQNNEKYPNPIEYHTYGSIAELNEEWEDYKPVEPLIKDEKICKALRAAYDAAPHRDNVIYFDGRWTFRGDKFEVMFDDREIKIEGWTEGKAYHIEELCGEEEECEI